MTQYRVIKVTTNDFGAYNYGKPSEIDEQVVWQGSDTDELSRQYPPSKVFGADPLGHSEIEDGLIRFDYRYERLEGDAWVKIDDPRRRLTPMTAVEREIDAENRRLYPGDYWDGCEVCGDGNCYGECQLDEDDPPMEDSLYGLTSHASGRGPRNRR